MEQKSSNTGAIVAIIIVLALAVGIGAWYMNMDDSVDADTNDTTTSQDANDTMTNETAAGDIVDTAAATDNLSTLVTAVQAADLVDTLKADGPYTVFAPTNDAFAALPDGTLDTLLKPENKDQLAGILTYHVVSGKVMAADLSDGQMIETVQGGMLKVEIKDSMVYLVDATGAKAMVSTPDVMTSNGVVHIIDSVVMPE